jgi:hypothetical protein
LLPQGRNDQNKGCSQNRFKPEPWMLFMIKIKEVRRINARQSFLSTVQFMDRNYITILPLLYDYDAGWQTYTHTYSVQTYILFVFALLYLKPAA